MEPIKIKVEFHFGYKLESPRRFTCEGTEVEIEKVLDRWLAAGKNADEPEADYFKVAGIDGHNYLLKHDLKSDQWLLENRW